MSTSQPATFHFGLMKGAISAQLPPPSLPVHVEFDELGAHALDLFLHRARVSGREARGRADGGEVGHAGADDEPWRPAICRRPSSAR
jgi:hypothetical protein